ncbi:MAG TPA: NHLP leader peptide family RiPP precursor [Longimicrobium sp.]|nr:NHLP leader peptide family RiPP precursor [Longimicrobium sp.]
MTTIAQVAEVVDRATFDPAFRQQLLSAPAATLQGAGIEVPDGLEVRVVENTGRVRHIVLPQKPEGLSFEGAATPSGGDSAAEKVHAHAHLVVDTWSDADLRARFMENPAAVLAERGVTVPDTAELRVLEANDRVVYLTLPPLASR